MIVLPHINEKDYYVLIDGERRLRASIAEKINEVPVRLVENVVDGRIIAYQIHMNRKKWAREAESKSILTIIEEEKKANPDIDEETLRRKLIEFTDHSNNEIRDFLNLFKYEQEIIDLVLDKSKTNHSISYIDQIEASFISPLKRNYPNLFIKYGESEVRMIMGYKFKKRLLVKTRYLMDTFKDVFQSEKNRSIIEGILDSFLSDKDKGIAIAYKEFQNIGKKSTSSTSNQGTSSDQNTDNSSGTNGSQGDASTGGSSPGSGDDSTPMDNHATIKLNKQEQTSVTGIKKKFEGIGKTFSQEEMAYIEEAIVCLQSGCLKAALIGNAKW